MNEDNNLEFSADENLVPLKITRKVRKVVRKVVAKAQEEDNNKLQRPFDVLYISQLSTLTFDELIDFAENYGINKDTSFNLKRQELMHLIVKSHINLEGKVVGEGTLEILQDGFGFLRSKNSNYLAASYDDIYISPSQIRLFGLRTGDFIIGEVRAPKDNMGEKFFSLLRIEFVNGERPDNLHGRPLFDNLTPIFPNERINLEFAQNKISTRIINLFSPIGKGQRALVSGISKSGKTMMLQEIANAICNNYPNIKLFILLIGERPQEVTDMKSQVPEAEVIASTFDEPPEKHCQVSEIVLEKAKRLVENKHDVVIILDSITRLSTAYNLVVPQSGKLLAGGLDANALYKVKKFFGAARSVAEGGSLTIIASILNNKQNEIDNCIYQDIKSVTDMEIHLSGKLAYNRIFPAISIVSSYALRDDLLLTNDEFNKMNVLRNVIGSDINIDEYEFIEKMIAKMKNTKDNSEFLKLLNP